MSPLRRVSCCLLALTLAILVAEVCCNEYDVVMNAAAEAGETEERVKRQSIRASFTSDAQQRFTLNVQGVNTGVVLNEPALQTISIDANETVRYNEAGRSVVRTNSDMVTGTTFSNIQTFTFLEENGDVVQTGIPDTNGPGTLFVQGTSALFSRAEGLNSQIINEIPNLPPIIRPPTPVETFVTARDTAGVMNLVLNIDTPPDGFAAPSEDIIELTGAMTFLLSDTQSIFQRRPLGAMNTDLLLTGGTGGQSMLFQDIARFSTLLPVSRAGVIGSELVTYNAANLLPRSQPGPGILRVGKEGGQNVAFFSNIDSVNGQIVMDLVRMQLDFRVTDSTAEILAGQFPPGTVGERLVMLNGAQSFSFPDATSVSMEGTAVSVFSGSQLLQRFDTGSTPMVSAFLQHQVTRSTTAPMTFNIPEGAGATLLFNMGDNEVFLYPSRNTLIGQQISAAQQTAGITPSVTTAGYSISSTPFGVATLRARVQGTVGDGVEVVQVSPGATIVDVGPGQFLSYKGMAVEIIDSSGMPIRMFPEISPLTINAQGVEYLIDEDNFTMIFSGPGRLYIDVAGRGDPNARQRAFYTGNPNIQSLITNFVGGLPQPPLNLVRDGRSGAVSIQSQGQNLFTLNGASALTAGPDQAGIYFGDQISLVNVFDVPSNTRAFYTATDNRIRVPDPSNPGSFLFDMAAGNSLWDLVGDQVTQHDPGMDRTFPFMNGFIYFGDNGAFVAESDTINDGISRILTNDNGIHLMMSNIQSVSSPMLTVVGGNSIFTYNGQSPTRLPRGGTYYTSADGSSSIYIADTEFNARVGGIYSQLNPSNPVYNSTTRTITLTTSEGEFISSLRPGITETRSIDRNGFITYAGGSITFDPAIRGPIGGISSLVFWDGFMATTFNATENITFAGPGIFWVEGNTAFYTSDPTTVGLLRQRINSVTGTFRPPFISSTPRNFRSKFRTVMGGFPQNIEVYEGADIMLTCSVPAANPPATIRFERRFFNMTSNRFEYETIMDGDNAMITMIGNSALLTIQDIMADDNINAFNNTGVFRCIASNIAGSVRRETTVNILPPEAPAIVTGFLPPLSFRRNSSDRLVTIRAGDSSNMLDINFRTFTIEGVAGSAIRDNESPIIARTLHIGCKGEGRPKSDIMWYELDQSVAGTTQSTDLGSADRMLINDTLRDDVVITEPREGRSVLSISLQPDPAIPMARCRRFICEAMNLGGVAVGGVDICTQYFECEETIGQGDCSGTCGLGIAPRIFTSCLQFTDMNMGGDAIEYNSSSVLMDLFPLSPILCGFERAPCPVITYQYATGPESDCSVTCGTGSTMRNVTCEEVTTTGDMVVTMTVDDSFCVDAGLYRPSMFMTCSNNPPCPLWNISSAFGECSVTCGTGGVRTRSVTCVQAVHNETTFELILGPNNETIFMDVADDLCSNATRPLETTSCDDRIPCPLRWRPLVWNPCPTAGPMRGCQTREIVCEEFLLNDYGWPGTTVNDSECEALGLRRPHTVRNCQGFICDFGDWVVGRDQSECSVTCGGGGTLVQTVECRDRNNGSILEDGYCNILERPKEVVPCPFDLNFLRSLNCPGVCDYEPAYCPLVRMLGCEIFLMLAESCCKSCPKQATPIVIPPTEILNVTVTAMP